MNHLNSLVEYEEHVYELCKEIEQNLLNFENLFSYGTLQDESVQLATFGRKLAGEPDALIGYRQTQIRIKDPSVVAATGAEYYFNAEFTGRESDVIPGTLFKVTRQELEQADLYEEDADYKRVVVELKSGARSWVYISATSSQPLAAPGRQDDDPAAK